MDTGNMHKKLGKDRACGSGDILADRQTHRQAYWYSLQYFATPPAGEVIAHAVLTVFPSEYQLAGCPRILFLCYAAVSTSNRFTSYV